MKSILQFREQLLPTIAGQPIQWFCRYTSSNIPVVVPPHSNSLKSIYSLYVHIHVLLDWWTLKVLEVILPSMCMDICKAISSMYRCHVIAPPPPPPRCHVIPPHPRTNLLGITNLEQISTKKKICTKLNLSMQMTKWLPIQEPVSR